MIELRDLTICFNRNTPAQTQALKALNLTIPTGQFVTIIGGNGAGKSTLLNAICGEIACDEGDILIHGKKITHWSVAQRAALIGRVFQDPLFGTCSELSIEENLSLALRRGQKRSFSAALQKAKRSHLTDLLIGLNLGLENRLQEPIGLLSGGQRQAISLLMTVLSPLKILILDEHTAALDPKTTAFMLNLTQQLIDEHRPTVFMVTHSLQQALTYGDRLLMLHQGEIILDLDAEVKKTKQPADLLQMFDSL